MIEDLQHIKSYLVSWMDKDSDYLDESIDDRFTYYADACGVSPFVLRNWLSGRGKPNWNKIKNALDNLGVNYTLTGE